MQSIRCSQQTEPLPIWGFRRKIERNSPQHIRCCESEEMQYAREGKLNVLERGLPPSEKNPARTRIDLWRGGQSDTPEGRSTRRRVRHGGVSKRTRDSLAPRTWGWRP